MQHAQAAERADLIVEATAPQLALFAEEQEARKVVRGLAFVQLPSLPPAVFLVVDRAQDVDGALHPADLIQGLVHAVLARIRAQPVQDQGRRGRPSLDRRHDADRLIPCAPHQVGLDGALQDRVQVPVLPRAVELVEGLLVHARNTRSEGLAQQGSRGHDDLGVAVGIGIHGARIQLRVVLHQAVEDEGRFAQAAGDGLLMQAHRVFARVGVERDAAAAQEMAEVGGQDVDGHVEAHAIRRTGIAEPIEVTQRQMDGEVDQVHTGGLQRLAGQRPICRLADLPDAQAGGRGHAGGPDVAADGDQSGQGIAPLHCRGQAVALVAVEEVAQEIRLVVDVDEHVDQLDLGQPRLEQILEACGGVLRGAGLEAREMVLALVAVDGHRRTWASTPAVTSCSRASSCVRYVSLSSGRPSAA